MSEPLLVVVGPTAGGKTELALRLAERYGGEIVSADSVQLYRRFDAGSGKPTAEERARAPHHLIDWVEPDAPMDAARWVAGADAAIAEIRARGKRPIVCGGTFLWVRSLIWGLSGAPPADERVRARHRERAEREGRAALHAELARVDPRTAARLAPNDLVRVGRALEVFELTGTPLSAWHDAHGLREQRYPARLLGVERARDELDRRIHARVEQMLARGWVEEVRALIREGYGEARAMSSVGYFQVAEAVQGRASSEPGALTEAIWRATRVFARRQRTWLRERGVEWLSPDTRELPGL